MALSLPNVCMVGLGYIGLPTAAVIAQAGCRVRGVDVRPEVVRAINAGKIHIEETDLEAAVQQVVKEGLLEASTCASSADVFIIAVPTPFHLDGNHTPDTTQVLAAAREIAPHLKPGDTVILESTCPIGTTEAIRDLMAEMRRDLVFPRAEAEEANIAIAYCPERVLPGRIMKELRENDRAIGGITEACSRKATGFYELFVEGQCISTHARSAEMTKLVENSFRDVNIAFANELSMVADQHDLDVWEVIRLANRHPRVNILQPGPGVGGHCIAVDPWFLVHGAPSYSRLVRTAREVNDGKVDYVLEKARRLLGASPTARAACLGLAFKADIDDFRESPALYIANALAREYASRVDIVEPFAECLPSQFDGTSARLTDITSALMDCEILIVLVDHSQFKQIKSEDRIGKRVLDTRGIWS